MKKVLSCPLKWWISLSLLGAASTALATRCEQALREATQTPQTRQIRQEIFTTFIEDFPVLLSPHFRRVVIEELSKNGIFFNLGVENAAQNLLENNTWVITPQPKDKQTLISEKIWQRLQSEFRDLSDQQLRQLYGKHLKDQDLTNIRHDIEKFSQSPIHSEQMHLWIQENLVGYLKVAWWLAKGNVFVKRRKYTNGLYDPVQWFTTQFAGFMLGVTPSLAAISIGQTLPDQPILSATLLGLGATAGLAIANAHRVMNGFSHVLNFFYKKRLHDLTFGDQLSASSQRRDRQRLRSIEQREREAEKLFDRIQLEELTQDISQASLEQAQNINTALIAASMALGLRTEIIGLKYVNETAVVRELRRTSKTVDRLKPKKSAKAQLQRINGLLRLSGLLRDRSQEILQPREDLAHLLEDIDFLAAQMTQLRERFEQLEELHRDSTDEIKRQRIHLGTTEATLEINRELTQGRQQRIVTLTQTIQALQTKILSTLSSQALENEAPLSRQIEEIHWDVVEP